MFLAVALVPAVMAGESSPQLKFLGTLEGARPSVYSTIAFSPDGKLLAVGDYEVALIDEDGKDHPGHSLVQLWDVDKRKVIATLRGHSDADLSLVFSRDGKTLVSVTEDGYREREIKLWDVATGKEKTALKPEPKCYFLALSRDGKTVALVNDESHRVILWDTATQKEKVVASLKGFSGLIGPAGRGEREGVPQGLTEANIAKGRRLEWNGVSDRGRH
jgi:dipeptidyl aminopeptidase/acylaminoacyl peptidase